MLQQGRKQAQWRKSDTKGHVSYDSIDRQCPEQASTERQKVGYWLPGSGEGREEWEVNVVRGMNGVSFWGDENVLGLNSGDGCTPCDCTETP